MTQPSSRPRRSGRRGLVAALIVLALVLVAFVAVDRYAVQRAEAEAVRQLQTELNTPNPPTVDIQDFPFLPQLLVRSARTVHVVAEDVSAVAAEEAVPVRRLDLTATGVKRPAANEPVTADRLEGTATLDYSSLPKVGAQAFSYAGDGRVRLDLGSSGLSWPAGTEVTGRPELDVAAQTVTLAEPTVTVAGVPLPAATGESILAAVVKPVPVQGVPLGLRVTSLSADEAGMQAGVVGDDVVLRP